MKEFYTANKLMEVNRNIGRSTRADSVNVRYGKEESAKELFNDVFQAKNKDDLLEKVKILIQTLEKNNENNSFFKLDEEINISLGLQSTAGAKIRIDDVNIYKRFFDIYSDLKQKNPAYTESRLHMEAVRGTINSYFGEFDGNIELRNKITAVEQDAEKLIENDMQIEATSIENFKGKNCAMCVERASVAHNLWLLGGYESYFVDTASIEFEGLPDEAHAYCIVNYNGTFKLFDDSMGIYKAFEEGVNPVEDILNGKPLIVNHKGKELIYANSFAKEEEFTV